MAAASVTVPAPYCCTTVKQGAFHIVLFVSS
jgi:hypothetical protein